MNSILTYMFYNGLRVLGQTTDVSQQHAFSYSTGHYATSTITLSDSIKTAVALNRTVQITNGPQTYSLTPGTEQTLSFPGSVLHCLLDSTSFKVFNDSTTSTGASGTTTFTLKSTLVQPLDLPQETWSPNIPQGSGIARGDGWYINVNTKELHCVDSIPFIIVFTSQDNPTNQITLFVTESDSEYIILNSKDGDELRFEYDITSNEYIADISSYLLPPVNVEIEVTPLMHSKVLLVDNKIICTSGSFVAKLQPYLPTSWDLLPTPADRGFDVIFDSDVVHLLTDANHNNVLRTPDGALRGVDILKDKFYHSISNHIPALFGFNTNNPSQLAYETAINNALEGLPPATDSTYLIQLVYSTVPLS